jgi:predicted RNase H-like HicB family nuclease
MKREFTALYHKQGKYVTAWVEEIPGVNTQGKTEREARENLKEALRLIIETRLTLMIY